MEKLITRRNFEITKIVTKFWQQAALVCCMVLFFGIGTTYSQCITNSATTSDLYACDQTSVEIAVSQAGLKFPTPGAAISWQWQVCYPINGGGTFGTTFVNVNNGDMTPSGLGVYSNASGTVPDVNFGRNLLISEDSQLDSTKYRVILTYNAGYCNNPLTTNAMVLYIFEPPTLSITASPSPVCNDGPGMLIAHAHNPDPDVFGYAYQWQANGVDIPGETNSTLSFAHVNSTTLATTYSVEVTEKANPNGGQVELLCFKEAQGNFTLNFPPEVSCPGNLTLCSTDEATTISASVTAGTDTQDCPVVVSWKDPNGTIVSNTKDLILSGASLSGAYVFTASNCCGNTTCTTNLTINTAPKVSCEINPESGVICAGPNANVTFTAFASGTPFPTYQWQFNGSDIAGATNSAFILSGVTTLNQGTYTVIVTNICNSASCSKDLTVNEAPGVKCFIDPENGNVCVGGNATFTASATGTPAPTYQWQFNNVNIAGETNSVLSLTNVTTSAQGTYKVIVTNTCGSANCSKDLTVNTAPLILSFATPEDCIPSKNVAARTFTFTAFATGTLPLNFQWSKNGTDLTGETNSIFSITTNDANDQGTYKVVVSNVCGSTSESGTISPCPCIPPSILEQPTDKEVCQGQSATFNVLVTGTAPLMYQWFDSNGAIVGATNDSYVTGVAGTYFVVVTNDPTNCGEALTSDRATLTVNPNLAVTCMPTVTKGNPADNAVFGVTIITGVNVTYQWSFDGNILAGETNSTYTRTLLVSDNGKQICVVVSSSCGEPATCCTTLDVCTTPTVSCPQGGPVCLGGSITFTATGEGAGPFSFQWYKSCCQKETVPCEPCNQYKKWKHCKECKDNNKYDKDCDNFDFNKCYNDWSKFWNGCDNNDCKSCPKQTQLVCTTVPIQGAIESALTLTNVQYSDTCRYFVVLTGPCGSATSCNATITITKPPVIKTQPVCTDKCVNDCFTLTVKATGTGTLTYQWFKENVNIVSATNSAFAICPIALSDAGKYKVVVSNNCGSVTSDVTILKVNTPPVLTCQPKDVKVCSSCSNNYFSYFNYYGTQNNSSKACFTVCTSGDKVKIQWLENGKPINYCLSYSGANSPTLCVLDLNGKNGFVYSAIVTNGCGSVTSDGATLTSINPPVICKQPVNLCVIDGGIASFSVRATGDNLIYQWQLNGQNITDGSIFSGSTTNTLNISNVSGLNNSIFTVIVSNSCSSVTSCKVTLQVKSSCNPPTNLSSCEPTSFSEKIVWGKVSGANGYQIAVFCGNSNYPSYFNVNDCSNFVLCNLKSGTKYCWKIRTACGNCGCLSTNGYNQSTYSDWSESSCFTTPACQNKKLMDVSSSISSDEELKVYPNPSNGLITVNMPVNSDESELSIFNMSGQVVYTEKVLSLNDSNKQIDMSAYGRGVYFVRLTNSEYVKTIKLIVQ